LISEELIYFANYDLELGGKVREIYWMAKNKWHVGFEE
jgi:hypothetical protein